MLEPARATLVGRRAIVDELESAVLAGGCRVLSGVAGVGKSRVLVEVSRRCGSAARVVELYATASAAVIPFGVFLSLIDMPATMLEAATAIRARLTEPGTVVLLDDAHLMDAASAGLLLDVARGGTGTIVAVRSGEPLRDAVEALSRLPGASIVAVPPLDDAQVAQLLRTRLAAPPDAGLITFVARRSRGIPLYADAVLESLRAGGLVRVSYGTSHLTAGPAPRVEHPIDEAVAGAPADVREAAACVALADGLAWDDATALLGASMLERAESAGLIALRVTARSTTVVARHPIVADSLIATVGEVTRRRILGMLVDAENLFAADPVKRARVVMWKAELGRPLRMKSLLRTIAAVQAAAPSLADLLLDVALSRVSTLDERLALAGMLAHQHRLDDAEEMLALPEPEALSSTQRRSVAMVRSFLLAFPGNEPARAREIIEAEPDQDDPELRAHLGVALMQEDRIGEALAVTRAVMTDESASILARAHAAVTASSGAYQAGDAELYARIAAERDELTPLVREAVPEAVESSRLIDAVAMLELGTSLDAAERRIRDGYDRALLRGDDGQRASHATLLARALIERGRPVDARPLAVEGDVTEGLWSLAFRATSTGTHVDALALGGESGAARELLDRLRARLRSPLYDVDVARAEGVVLAMEGDPARAAETILEVAVGSARRGAVVRARLALDQAVRWGSRPAAEAVLHLTEPPGARRELSDGVARAVLAEDGAALVTAADAYAARGFLWRSVELTALAAARFGAAPEVARRMHARCPQLRIALGAADTLTARERDVARRAADGATDAQIAAAMHVSVRTVQTHLGRVYAKLGIHRRQELRRALSGRPPA
jgi:DNA-binding CsgD family transcriptional regulator